MFLYINKKNLMFKMVINGCYKVVIEKFKFEFYFYFEGRNVLDVEFSYFLYLFYKCPNENHRE